MKILIGKKIGMTQVFDAKGMATPVTVIDVSNNIVSNVLTSGDTITHIEIAKDKKNKEVNNALKGIYKKLGFVPRVKHTFKKALKEESAEVGTELFADLFTPGDIIDVQGTSKGKGFQGVMKRWGFVGGKATHGQSDRARAPGSIGSGTTPGRVYKGKRMAGRMGGAKTTIKRLKIVTVDRENGLISVSGAIPGAKGTYVIIEESYFNASKKA